MPIEILIEPILKVFTFAMGRRVNRATKNRNILISIDILMPQQMILI